MKKSNKRLLVFLVPLVIFSLVMVMLFQRLGKDPEINPSQAVGKPLPTFSLPLLSDTSRTLTNADLPKKPFVLLVWASWCTTCFAEHPFLMQLHGEGVPMIGVNYKDELSDALGYLSVNKDPYIYSIQDYPGRLGIDLGLTGTPETFFVGDDGVVYKHVIGEMHEENWRAEMKPCLDALNDQSKDSAAKMAACQ